MNPVLEIENLHTEIEGNGPPTRAVDGVSLEIRRGETFALVGESGCGKSMTALSVMRLLPEAGRITAGSVRVHGEDVLAMSEAQMRDVRGRRIAMIFQEPATSLNAVMTVGRQIEEVLERHLGLSGAKARERAVSLLDAVGVPDAPRRIDEYPFQLSGGLKQRVMIAMALAAEPDVLVADEPTTALDVTVQAQILDLIGEQRRERNMSVVLVTHDLGVVAGHTDEIAVMYGGKLVEKAPTKRLFAAMKMPYTEALLASIPKMADSSHTWLNVIPGRPPDLVNPPTGCRFAPRCPYARERCTAEEPPLTVTPDDPSHSFACWYPVGSPEYHESRARIAAGKVEAA